MSLLFLFQLFAVQLAEFLTVAKSLVTRCTHDAKEVDDGDANKQRRRSPFSSGEAKEAISKRLCEQTKAPN
jgi:hypothetical protein